MTTIQEQTIFVYSRQGRTAVVAAFRRAKWKPYAESAGYTYYSVSQAKEEARIPRDIGPARYYVQGTVEQLAKLNEELEKVWEEGARGFEGPYK